MAPCACSSWLRAGSRGRGGGQVRHEQRGAAAAAPPHAQHRLRFLLLLALGTLLTGHRERRCEVRLRARRFLVEILPAPTDFRGAAPLRGLPPPRCCPLAVGTRAPPLPPRRESARCALSMCGRSCTLEEVCTRGTLLVVLQALAIILFGAAARGACWAVANTSSAGTYGQTAVHLCVALEGVTVTAHERVTRVAYSELAPGARPPLAGAAAFAGGLVAAAAALSFLAAVLAAVVAANGYIDLLGRRSWPPRPPSWRAAWPSLSASRSSRARPPRATWRPRWQPERDGRAVR